MHPKHSLVRPLAWVATLAALTGCNHGTGHRPVNAPSSIASPASQATRAIEPERAHLGIVTMNTLVTYRVAGAPQRAAFSTNYQLCAPACQCLPVKRPAPADPNADANEDTPQRPPT